MGLVKTRWRLAEDGSPHRAARPESAPHRAGRKCCQCGSVASSNVANFQLGIEIGSRGAPVCQIERYSVSSLVAP